MKIRVTDWRCENLRIGQGIESFELGNPPARWSLIQMPNGLGKTSTMTLIRAVLGEEKLSPEKVRGFRANDAVENRCIRTWLAHRRTARWASENLPSDRRFRFQSRELSLFDLEV